MTKRDSSKRIRSLKKKLSFLGDRVKDSIEERICYSYDSTDMRGLPDLVVFPRSTEEVSRVMSSCNRGSVVVYPRGAGTGYSGGSIPDGGVALSLELMNRILFIDSKHRLAVVEPGVVNAHLQREALAVGLYYPPDPASMELCTIGGNVAECSSGPKTLKYGTTSDYVLGLEAVLPDGRVTSTGIFSGCRYDLTPLVCGSEGTLAVSTKIALCLVAPPKARATLAAHFEELTSAAELVGKLPVLGVSPSVMELMDPKVVECVLSFAEVEDAPEVGDTMLLCELEGTEEDVLKSADKLETLIYDAGAKKVIRASDESTREKLWTFRRSISGALAKLAPVKINEDICVPRSNFAKLVSRLHEIEEMCGYPVLGFGHAGDGNIHVNIMLPSRDRVHMEKAEAAVEKLFEIVLSLGGTISGEHGIGITKAGFLVREIGEAGIILTRSVKEAFDQDYLLNRAKLIQYPSTD
jgi:glycolate oxidase